MSNPALGNTTNGASASGSGAASLSLTNPLAFLPVAAEGRMNLAALQQKDPYITAIVDTAKQVALYLFSAKENEWERTAIEGTLFVYRRSASPDNGFMILNRLGPNNLIEPITKDLEFQLHDPFLLYRTAKAICGIWFYDKDECARVGQLMNSLVQLAITNHHAKTQNCTRQRRASESDSLDDRSSDVKKEPSIPVPIVTTATPQIVTTSAASMPANRPVGILQLLTKAQHEYDKSKDIKKRPEPVTLTDNPGKAAASSTSLIRPTPLCIGNSSQNSDNEIDAYSSVTLPGREISSQICLEKLFSSNDVGKNTSKVANQSPLSNISNRDNEIPSNQMPSIMKQLGSTVSLVEDIERQQRGEAVPSRTHVLSSPTTAQDVTSGVDMLRNIYQNSSNLTTSTILNQNTGFQQLHSVVTSSALTNSHSSDQGFALSQSPKEAISNLGHMNANNPQQMPLPEATHTLLSPIGKNAPGNAALNDSMANLLVARLDHSANSGLIHNPSPAATKTGSQSLLTPADLETIPSGPHSSGTGPTNLDILLSPMAFVSPQAKSATTLTNSCNSGDVADVSHTSLVPLTKEQLQQALLYLLRNDANFLAKIHEAYLSTLNNEASNL
ncbi:mRNA-decapping enzyme 1A [Octopus bimaculoides]|uniref:5'-(N(7)-methylguanosine 5'-triphospho)-[mRNA] hydrolase n=1 Tax=Octopus bimaculoides TaxID=37653 RepID=A0A0L8I6N4_OCTBM|nr:mRNA-decapping enzyme 1A [Octopus bimaculoides]XP_014790718.1 mRNA-decapping enzyme 1A [Octopus bimaculoides]XP_014790719.1 mRNA-decapping enzyme 1A [Octopus bimaculoides]XP_014790720.1 mRNA-decapping enzyme 1A [Octopus bimaculoides]XP_052828724.1 mRNA-decapping enzyme 1A [Octopus bimaculoides]XP_052828725.1 mRNA-decapping enzyme 1A [Octopus bimaculoides]XP_052828726.1 mRNA-decapping enzyme 1A [Octopus bimaculoides]XP_052828727.1 mRNA-decapping enzyme 1A [Octopus bimaculoides]|eukprot:XP_014790716.1 PREDICTED: mRNA-decapping enzyme 1A-like [Octopus bimaculoides]